VKNPSIRSLVVPYGRTDGQAGRQRDGQTEMTKLIATFGNLAKASKNFRFQNALNYRRRSWNFE